MREPAQSRMRKADPRSAKVELFLKALDIYCLIVSENWSENSDNKNENIISFHKQKTIPRNITKNLAYEMYNQLKVSQSIFDNIPLTEDEIDSLETFDLIISTNHDNIQDKSKSILNKYVLTDKQSYIKFKESFQNRSRRPYRSHLSYEDQNKDGSAEINRRTALVSIQLRTSEYEGLKKFAKEESLSLNSALTIAVHIGLDKRNDLSFFMKYDEPVNEKLKRVNIRLEPELARMLKIAAQNVELTTTSFVRHSIQGMYRFSGAPSHELTPSVTI